MIRPFRRQAERAPLTPSQQLLLTGANGLSDYLTRRREPIRLCVLQKHLIEIVRATKTIRDENPAAWDIATLDRKNDEEFDRLIEELANECR